MNPVPVNPNVSGTNVTCNGFNNGTATSSPTGGTGPYTYAWSPGGEITNSVTGLSPGTYTVTVSDTYNCSASQSITITEPAVLTTTPSGTNLTCGGVCNGTSSANAAGGTGPYNYAWSPGGSVSATPSNLCAGTYSVTVTDANFCTVSGSVTITEPPLLTANIVGTNTSCNGICDGSATASGAGGTPGYTYAWSNGAVGATANALCAGTYTVTVTDIATCTATQTVTITQPPSLAIGVGATNLTCNGVCTGAATASVIGGTPGYTYAWSNGAGNVATINNLCAGTYTVTVTDANNCTLSQNVTITQPNLLTVALTPSSIACNGDCNATIATTVNGGTAGYTYSWAPGGETTNSLANLCAGTYSVTVTDANTCTVTASVTITQPPVLTLTTTSTNITCNGACNGTANGVAAGGTGPYNYSWAPGAFNTASINNLCPGTYTLTLTDGNSCTVTSAVTITQPPVLLPNASATAVACNGGSTGSVTSAPSGGTAPYDYLWSPGGETTATVNGLPAGSYTVVVTDDNGCTANQTVTITEPAVLNPSISATTATCGLCDGTATVAPSGGTGPYVYAWSTAPVQNNATATNLCPGTYSVTVTDANGCTATNSVTVNQLVTLTVTSSVGHPTCTGVCDASATAAAAGGAAPYTYAWAPGGQTTATITNLCAGTYTVTARDFNGCTSTAAVTFVDPPVLTLTTSQSNVSCNGACDGTATATPAGGTAPYTYAWAAGGATTQTISSLCAGTFTVTVRDFNGCTVSGSVTIAEQPSIVTTPTALSPSDCITCDGSISLSTVGGDGGPYSYAWNTGSTSNPLVNLCAGVYSVITTDGAGCTQNNVVTLNNVTGPTVTPLSTNVTCNGGCNGTGSVNVIGGTAPYDYLWIPGGQTVDSRTDLCAGTYNVQVTDAASCVSIATITITEPAPFVPNATVTGISCAGTCTGSISLAPAGGTGAYSYLWAPGAQTTASITAQCAGTYSVTITDASGCDTSFTYTITEPSPLSNTFNIANVSCNGACDGVVIANTSGGVTPYDYAWSGGQVLPTVTNLCPGTYSVTVTDANLCTISSVVTITEPLTLTSVISSSNVTCNGACDGTALITGAGGTLPYIYSWLPGSETTAGINNLCPGTYDVTLTDANGCISVKSAMITEPPLLVPNASVTAASCNGSCNGTATANPAGGTGAYNYLWSPGGQTTASVSGLCAGTYTVLVTDASGCTANQTVSVTEPSTLMANASSTSPACNGGCNGTAISTPAGGTAPFVYSWSNGSTANSISGLCANNYTVTVTDGNGCTNSQQVTVTDPLAINIAASTSPTNCSGPCTGAVTVTPSGGSAPYAYSWAPGGETTNALSNLCAGVYTVTVTDANLCDSTFTITINSAGGPTGETVATVNVSCHGACTGIASVAPIGGAVPYVYLWNDPSGQTNDTATGLCAGSYFVRVTDANGCVRFSPVTITEPDLIVPVATITNAACNGICTGAISLGVSGGVGAYNYSWSPGAQTTASISNVCAGTYTVSIIDGNLCTVTNAYTVGQNSTLAATVSPLNPGCNGSCNGSAAVTVTSGSVPYSYLWSNGQTAATATALCAGTYSVTITDGAGCNISLSTTLTQPAAIAANDSVVNTNCGVCTGSITVAPTGGSAPYFYSWSNGETTASMDSLCAGVYNLTITDAAGCISTFAISVSSTGGATAANVTTTPESCYGYCNGTATVQSITGGVGPYNYLWLPGGQITSSVTGLCQGNYNVQVTDALGCAFIAAVTITGPTQIMANPTVTSPSGCGVCDGRIVINPSGGSGPYTYTWNTGSNNDTLSNICAGTYTVTLTDGIGCTQSASVTLNNIGAPTLTTAKTNVNCNSACNGTASVSVSGGTAPYTYSWSPGGSTNDTISGLCAGSYTVKVTDFAGCVVISSPVTIDEPATIIANPTVKAATCGACNGRITLSPLGGTAPYNYQWSNGETTASIDSLCASIYNVTITDDVGCTASFAVAVSNTGGPTAASISTTSETCYGYCNGTANVQSVTGGTAPYSYLWLPGGQITSSVTGLCQGNYNVQITDSNNCILVVPVTITGPTQLVANEIVTNPSTCLVCDGQIVINPSGGSSPYSYTWNTGSTNDTISNLCAGIYTVILNDKIGCTQSATITVSSISAVTLTVSKTNVSCNSACNGMASVIASGGTGAYTYSWSPGGSANDSITNLCAGTYFVSVRDAAGCLVVSSPIIITEPAPIVANPTIKTATCGICNGRITLTPLGGTGSYKYLWANGETTASIDSLCTGVYSVDITDATGCKANFTIPVNNSGGPTGASLTATGISCYGICDGSATVSPIGGVAPYTYLWIPGGQTTNSLTGLCGGNYNVQITDSNNCSYIKPVTIADPGQIKANQSVIGPSACLACDGRIIINPSGGTAPYTYLWNNGATNDTLLNLCAGLYTVIIKDFKGCTQSVSIPLVNINAPGLTVSSTNTSCFSGCTGTASVIVAGGVAPYDYSWTSGATTATATALCAGTYYVKVTDALGCIAVSSPVTITQPTPMAFSSPNVINVSCAGSCTGSAGVIVSGGTLPYAYSWSNGQSAATAVNLCAGNYTVTVTDARGCSNFQLVSIVQPSAMTLSSTSTNASCSSSSDGSINVTVGGGTGPYSYQWYGSSNAKTEDLVNIKPGTYIIVATDSKGCQKSDTITITAITIVEAHAGEDTTFCEKTSVLLDGSKSIGAGSYKWYALPAMTLVGSVQSVSINPPGGKSLYILVALNGVCSDTDSVYVISSPLPVASAGVDYRLVSGNSIVIGGSPTGASTSTFMWKPSTGLSDSTAANPVASPTVTTTYIVTVTNPDGCSATDTMLVYVYPDIVFPNGISPNGDGANDKWLIDKMELFPECVVEVYNRWGELLFHSVGYKEPWDGTFKGEPLPVGTYYYIINLNDSLYPQVYTGPITIIR